MDGEFARLVGDQLDRLTSALLRLPCGAKEFHPHFFPKTYSHGY
jgi:hypothetical protein